MLRVVVATDDGARVRLGHFGDAAYYYIYRVGSSRAVLEKIIENPERRRREHGHGEEGKRRRLLGLLGEIDAIVSTFYGPGGTDFFKKHGVVPVSVKPGTSIEEALRIAAEILHGGR